MKRTLLFALISIHATFVYAQLQTDCGCNAALRYDINKLNSNFYSEMLLAREIKMENYKDLRQKAGGNLSIFGLEVGANGENVQRIQQIYQEKLLNVNISRQMIDYESRTTSSMSYDAFVECMSGCFKSRIKGLQAYIVHEDGSGIDLDLYYGTEPRNRRPLLVRYRYNNQEFTVNAIPNEFNPIHINRVDRRGFTLVFTSGQFQSQPVTVKPFTPLTASVSLTYAYTVERSGNDIVYSQSTDNNDNRGCFPCDNRLEMDKRLIGIIGSQPDGPGRLDNLANDDRSFMATRVWFKATAPTGYFLRNPKDTCIGNGNTCTFTEPADRNKKYLVNNSSQVIYTSKHYSAPVSIQFRVQTFRIDKESDQTWSFSTDSTISFLVPKTTTNGIMRYGSGLLELGKSNNDFQLVGEPIIVDDGFKIYFYKVLKPLDEAKATEAIKKYELN